MKISYSGLLAAFLFLSVFTSAAPAKKKAILFVHTGTAETRAAWTPRVLNPDAPLWQKGLDVYEVFATPSSDGTRRLVVHIDLNGKPIFSSTKSDAAGKTEELPSETFYPARNLDIGAVFFTSPRLTIANSELQFSVSPAPESQEAIIVNDQATNYLVEILHQFPWARRISVHLLSGADVFTEEELSTVAKTLSALFDFEPTYLISSRLSPRPIFKTKRRLADLVRFLSLEKLSPRMLAQREFRDFQIDSTGLLRNWGGDFQFVRDPIGHGVHTIYPIVEDELPSLYLKGCGGAIALYSINDHRR